jgi:mono/diheme cytochrome c family protein
MHRRPFPRTADLAAAGSTGSTRPSRSFLSSRTAAIIAAVLSAGSIAAPPASAQTEPKQPAKDYLQRSLEIYEFRKAAPGGPERGQEIFYYKCWFCHNEFVADIPQLKGLYQKANLVSGQPVNDATVKDKLRGGGPGMPAYKYVLNDTDLNDLVSYLKEKCCWDSDSPPPNPRYRAR